MPLTWSICLCKCGTMVYVHTWTLYCAPRTQKVKRASLFYVTGIFTFRIPKACLTNHYLSKNLCKKTKETQKKTWVLFEKVQELFRDTIWAQHPTDWAISPDQNSNICSQSESSYAKSIFPIVWSIRKIKLIKMEASAQKASTTTATMPNSA